MQSCRTCRQTAGRLCVFGCVSSACWASCSGCRTPHRCISLDRDHEHKRSPHWIYTWKTENIAERWVFPFVTISFQLHEIKKPCNALKMYARVQRWYNKCWAVYWLSWKLFTSLCLCWKVRGQDQQPRSLQTLLTQKFCLNKAEIGFFSLFKCTKQKENWKCPHRAQHQSGCNTGVLTAACTCCNALCNIRQGNVNGKL